MAKRKKKKEPKPEKIKTIKNRLWGYLKEIVHFRDNSECQYNDCSNKGKFIHLSHISPVGLFPWMTFDLDNVTLHCYRCHFMIWHKDIIASFHWWVNHVSAETVHWMYLRRLEKQATTREALYEKEIELLTHLEMIKGFKNDC